jgi:hypothetical protein
MQICNDCPTGSPATFLFVRKLRLFLGLGPSPHDKDVEIAVLGDQLAVIHHQVARPRFSPTDHSVYPREVVPMERWGALLVTPTSMPRWHRECIAGHLTFPLTGRSRNALDDEVVALVRIAVS